MSSSVARALSRGPSSLCFCPRCRDTPGDMWDTLYRLPKEEVGCFHLLGLLNRIIQLSFRGFHFVSWEFTLECSHVFALCLSFQSITCMFSLIPFFLFQWQMPTFLVSTSTFSGVVIILTFELD